MPIRLEREFYLPTGLGAVKVSDKASDAVAYLYTDPRGRPCARLFYGKQAKYVWAYSFRTADDRAAAIARGFKHRQEWNARKAEQAAARRKKSKLQLGHILVSSWGYEQTNVNFYQVTRLISATMVELRPIGICDEPTLYMQGRCTPHADAFTGEPIRRRVSWGDNVRINDSQTAHLWDGRPMSWSSYH
jgi:hypothetical protein